MKPALSLLSLPLTMFASCNVHHWRELRTEPMTIGAAWDGFVQVAASAKDGFLVDPSETDRGLAYWQSRWRYRQADRFPIRFRLKAEFLLDDGSPETGWLLRYRIEQEKVKDIRRHGNPTEDDWSGDGQSAEREDVLGFRLQHRLAPKSVELVRPQDDAGRGF